ncbi:MAG: hypothetical protein RMI01_09295 [Thermodesulfovibrio sp.]|nr:hypothetical protein [Thermodesulfovibrio sp.]
MTLTSFDKQRIVYNLLPYFEYMKKYNTVKEEMVIRVEENYAFLTNYSSLVVIDLENKYEEYMTFNKNLEQVKTEKGLSFKELKLHEFEKEINARYIIDVKKFLDSHKNHLVINLSNWSIASVDNAANINRYFELSEILSNENKYINFNMFIDYFRVLDKIKERKVELLITPKEDPIVFKINTWFYYRFYLMPTRIIR